MKNENKLILGIILAIMLNIVLYSIHKADQKTQRALSDMGYYSSSNTIEK
jgi:hypothetical protein